MSVTNPSGVRRRQPLRELARALTRRPATRDLLALDEVTRRLRPFSQHAVGIRPIPVANVVGTDSRGGDFDRNFRPRRAGVLERRQRVEDAFPDGAFPPIAVYQLGDADFVLDGHHRVAIARDRGRCWRLDEPCRRKKWRRTGTTRSTCRPSKRSGATGFTGPFRTRPSPTSSCGCTGAAATSSTTAAARRSTKRSSGRRTKPQRRRGWRRLLNRS